MVISSAISRLRWVSRFLNHSSLSESALDKLCEKAHDPSQDAFRWTDGAPLSEAKNAHYTNTKEQLTEGLSGEFNFMEGDIWMENAVRGLPLVDVFREPIMAHYPDDVTGLTLKEWLTVGKESGKGLKLDIKQSSTIPKLIKTVEESGLPQERLIFNADMAFGPGIKKDLKFRALDLVTNFTTQTKEMKTIREAFPKATIGVGLYTAKQPAGTTYSSKQLHEVITIAIEVGGPITFPLRAEFVTPEVVETLKPYGSISIWNDPNSYVPENFATAEKALRDMGVDGLIDLRDFPRPERPDRTVDADPEAGILVP